MVHGIFIYLLAFFVNRLSGIFVGCLEIFDVTRTNQWCSACHQRRTTINTPVRIAWSFYFVFRFLVSPMMNQDRNSFWEWKGLSLVYIQPLLSLFEPETLSQNPSLGLTSARWTGFLARWSFWSKSKFWLLTLVRWCHSVARWSIPVPITFF